MKKNQGFSLVELIVVIAIMAILVGVLAPAYLRYVEKSRKSSDVSAISDIMAAAEKIAIDVQYDLPANTKFTISIAQNTGAVTLNVGANTDAAADYTKAKKEWISISGGYDNPTGSETVYTLKSKDFKTEAATISGVVSGTGAVTWTLGTGKLVSYSSDFQKKWSPSATTE